MKLLFSHNETPSIIITMEVDDLPIELEVADALKSGHLMMGTAESCTGGKIASMIGYKDSNYFSLAFKKNTGYSPQQYRQKYTIFHNQDTSCNNFAGKNISKIKGEKL